MTDPTRGDRSAYDRFHGANDEDDEQMTDPTRAALVEALRAVDENVMDLPLATWDLPLETWELMGEASVEKYTDAILAQPAMARIEAVVDAAVEWRDMPRDGYLRAAVDALLAGTLPEPLDITDDRTPLPDCRCGLCILATEGVDTRLATAPTRRLAAADEMAEAVAAWDKVPIASLGPAAARVAADLQDALAKYREATT